MPLPQVLICLCNNFIVSVYLLWFFFFFNYCYDFYLEISKCFPLFHLSPLLTSNGKAGCKLKDVGFLNPLHGPLIMIMIIMIPIIFIFSLVINYFEIEICIVITVPCIDKTAVQRDWCKLATNTPTKHVFAQVQEGPVTVLHALFFSHVIALMSIAACCCYAKISDGSRLWWKAVAVWSCATAPGTFSL